MARTQIPISYTPGERFSLKDHLFNRQSVSILARDLERSLPNDTDFDLKKFTRMAVEGFERRKLKERIELLTDLLEKVLSDDFHKACTQIVRALPEPLDPTRTDNDFGEFIYEPFNTFIARHGCSEQYIDVALQTLEYTTQRFSAEFAVRPYIKQFEDRIFAYAHKWAQSDNYHVRRLASEGFRPSLPWGGKIDTDPKKIIAVLDKLYSDKTRYVVRSVANNLNDISKINADLVLKTLARWKKEGRQSPAEFAYLERHALRTGIKQGNRSVIEYLGYNPEIKYTISKIQHKDTVSIGGYQELSFDLTADESGGFLIDYVMYFCKADGTLSPKVMKIKDVALKKEEMVTIQKRYPMRVMSTRRLYPGQHAIAIQINGREVWKGCFELFLQHT